MSRDEPRDVRVRATRAVCGLPTCNEQYNSLLHLPVNMVSL